ncbi:MAG: iron chelate uptake ABC transporter family permease subunit, partial [Acholeplasmataceae bacterium]|nr:iron chelate uptake ABC transporter family permease subunit [Acholeplasmataceae bacterium]
NILQRRGYQVAAMMIAAVLIATTTLAFQTLTNNRILTPGLMGFDAIFVLSQTFIVFALHEQSALYQNPYLNFLFAASLMILITLIVYRLVLRKNKNHIVFLLLFGIIISTLSRNLASFLQTVMDPNQFYSVIIRTEVTITNMNTNIILLALPILIVIIGLFVREFKYLDVMALGETHAVGLGINYQKKMNTYLIYIAIAMSIATALIGPITFLGLLAVNAAREMLKTFKHLPLMIASSLIAIVAIVLGQTIIIELGYQTTVTVLISFVGGLYMIYLIIRENHKK